MKEIYKALQKEVKRSAFGSACLPLFRDLYFAATEVLGTCECEKLISKLEGKEYFSFSGATGRSRPINSSLFRSKPKDAAEVMGGILLGERHRFDSETITKSVYRFAITLCAGIDVTSTSDRKTQGTLFEWLSAAIMHATLGVVPQTALPVFNLDLKGNLPTDFVFDLGEEKPKFHLPVKTSTRERIIQVWAHQRVLDGVYGAGRFLAAPFILTETKLDSRKLEVVEICLPWQWRLYQMHIASLWNVCYLDLPSPYAALDTKFPRIGISTVGDALVRGGRIDQLLKAHGLGDNPAREEDADAQQT